MASSTSMPRTREREPPKTHSGRSTRRTRHDGLTAPLLGRYIGQGLIEHPLVSERVVHSGLPLAVLPVVRWIDHRGAASLGRFDNGTSVGDLEHQLMRAVLPGNTATRSHLGDDELGGRSSRKPELGAMAVPDPHVLDETEDLAVPGDRGAHVGDDEHRGDPGMRCGTVRQHPITLERRVDQGNRDRKPPASHPAAVVEFRRMSRVSRHVCHVVRNYARDDKLQR
jgi:hypothetical protein